MLADLLCDVQHNSQARALPRSAQTVEIAGAALIWTLQVLEELFAKKAQRNSQALLFLLRGGRAGGE